MDFKCNLCTAEFFKKSNLNDHLRRKHGIKKSVITDTSNTCIYCEKSFASKKTLSTHVVKIHKVLNARIASIKCQEDGCNEQFHKIEDLRVHLSTRHGVEGIDDCVKMQFKNFLDFQQWLAEEEKKSIAKFVVQTKRSFKNHVYISFWCNRSGVYKPGECGEKQLKAQGTRKIGFHCTAAVVVKDFSSHVEVSYYQRHYGHEHSLCHVPLPKEEKEQIAGKLLQGVTQKHILNDIREPANLDFDCDRKLLTDSKAIQNIKRDFGLTLPSQGSVVKEDELSVANWVSEMENSEDNPVLLHKRQDEPHPSIGLKDFVLVFMTSFQRRMLYRLGGDRICIDSTHGISNHGFELVTVMVIDEFEEGIPVAFCISSSVNTVILKAFFECIKISVTVISPKIFMSDDAVMFKNAWMEVFGPCASYLLCAWHVDRAWGKKILTLKKEIQSDVYKSLKTLMYELDVNNFQTMLSNFCEMLKDDECTKEFHDYFLKNYCNRIEMWAYCFRKGAKINTNMHIENFHRSLKHIYLDGKKTKRVDKVICELMRLVKDKHFDNYIKTQKGKITKRSTQNFKRHRDGKNLQATFEQTNENEWKVFSGTNVYYVSKVHNCDNSCIIACRNCVLCMKSYSCNCHDYIISNFLCKHIHFISINVNPKPSYNGPLYSKISSTSMKTPEPNNIKEYSVVNSSNGRNFISAKLMLLTKKWNELPSVDDVVLKQIKSHLNAVENLMKVKPEYSFQSKATSEPCNKKVTKQKRFYSVKKPRMNKKIKLCNPDSTEAEEKKNVLSGEELLHSQNSGFDHSYL